MKKVLHKVTESQLKRKDCTCFQCNFTPITYYHHQVSTPSSAPHLGMWPVPVPVEWFQCARPVKRNDRAELARPVCPELCTLSLDNLMQQHHSLLASIFSLPLSLSLFFFTTLTLYSHTLFHSIIYSNGLCV